MMVDRAKCDTLLGLLAGYVGERAWTSRNSTFKGPLARRAALSSPRAAPRPDATGV